MKPLPSRLRRLDDALAALPLEEPMLLSELDGFLTGILVCPERIMRGEWMQHVWGTDESGVAPFEDPTDVQWFADAVMARSNEIARHLQRGKLQPLFDVDERNGEVLWEYWVDGLAEAFDMRPGSWGLFAEDQEAVAALSRLTGLIAIARHESELDSVQINAMEDQAPSDLVEAVLRLYASSGQDGAAPVVPDRGRAIKVGRNEPCPCGSGKKAKRCCG